MNSRCKSTREEQANTALVVLKTGGASRAFGGGLPSVFVTTRGAFGRDVDTPRDGEEALEVAWIGTKRLLAVRTTSSLVAVLAAPHRS